VKSLELDEARETCVRHEQTESTLCSEFSSFKDQAKEKIAELQSQLYEINLKENLSDFKAEKAKYLKERKLFKEEHKENKQLKNDMIKLNETVNEMRETNEFLATQINSLTQHIFELNSDFPGNKENCGQSNDDVVPKLSNRLMETPSATFGVNKRVAELGGTTPQSRRIVVADSSLLNPVDMNSSGNFATPSRSPARIKTINSPSSIVKNQSPCTFQ
jgi:chromosome segregation ATPase